MQKIIWILFILVLCSGYDCNRSKSNKLKGRLVIKELCSHFVVQVVSGNIDSSLVTNDWRDDKRQQSFDQVFTVSNRCNFPARLKEGDEFEFTIDTNPPVQNCMVCMAYYPTPPKSNAIKIEPAK